MPKFSQFVIVVVIVSQLPFGETKLIGASHSLPHTRGGGNHLNEDQSAQNKSSWTSLPTTEQFLEEASSIFRKERDAGRRDSPSAHPPGSLLNEGEDGASFAHAPRRARRHALRAANERRVKLPDFHDIIEAHRRRMSRHFVVDSSNRVPVVNPPARPSMPSPSSPSTSFLSSSSSSSPSVSTTATTTASPDGPNAYDESHKVHTTSSSDHSFLPRKFTRRKKLHIVVGGNSAAAAAPAEIVADGSSSTDAALKREQDQLRTVDGAQEGSEQQLQKDNDSSEDDRVPLLSHIDDSGDGNIGLHENGQDSYTTLRPISAEVLNTDQSSFIPNFEGFSDMFFPSIRSPQVFQIVTEDFARAVPVMAASQRNREQLKHNCSMLLDSGYLPTGPETFAGECSLQYWSFSLSRSARCYTRALLLNVTYSPDGRQTNHGTTSLTRLDKVTGYLCHRRFLPEPEGSELIENPCGVARGNLIGIPK